MSRPQPSAALPAQPGTAALAWSIARAHLSRRRTQNLLTIGGIAVGVMALIAALSLTNGFTRALVDATLRATPHLSLNSFSPGGVTRTGKSH